jgi:hypothetical protein
MRLTSRKLAGCLSFKAFLLDVRCPRTMPTIRRVAHPLTWFEFSGGASFTLLVKGAAFVWRLWRCHQDEFPVSGWPLFQVFEGAEGLAFFCVYSVQPPKSSKRSSQQVSALLQAIL